MPRYYVIDTKGKAAVLHIDSAEEFPPRFYGSVQYIYNMDTAETLKNMDGPYKQMFIPNPFVQDIPVARVLLASTRIGWDQYGEHAMVWRIGFEADNGFSVPPVESLTPYVVRRDVKKATSVRDFTSTVNQ